jgi:type I restriction enzyme S subunit
MTTKTNQKETKKIPSVAKAMAGRPKLRFSDFSGEWHRREIKDVLKIGSGRDYKHLNSGNIPVFGTGGYMLSVDKALYEGESVLIGRKGTIDKPFYYKGSFWTVDTLFYTHNFKNITPKFTSFIFQQINWKKYNEASGVPSLSKTTIEKIKIIIPSNEEQQKIAEFLGGVDEWIENLRAQKVALEEYKKGMMQKIFPQEVRFKDDDGGEFGEWEDKRLGEICKITTGKLDANAMKEDGLYRFYTCAKEYFKIDKYAFNTEALLVSGNGANVGYIHYYKGKFNAYQRTYVLDKFDANIVFIKYFLDKNLGLRISNERKAGNTPYIVMSVLSDMKIVFPEKAEQQKIAEFLNSLDNLIESKQQQITLTEEWKKGLMQRLFV